MNVITETKDSYIKCRSKKRSILYIPVVGYLSFLAIERIDLLQGKGSFGFSLELLGCILFLACFLFDILYQRGRFLLSNRLISYMRIVIAFMITVLLSVPFSADVQLSARRVVLLSIYVFSGLFAVNYLFTQQPDNMSSIVVNCMFFLSIIYAVLSLYDVMVWYNPGMFLRFANLFPFFRGDVRSIGSSFVRVRGASGDSNRAGIFMVINFYIMLQYCKRPMMKVVICIIDVVVLALTLSRTAILCLVLYIILQVRVSKKINYQKMFKMIIILLLIIATIISLYQVPVIKEAVGHTLDRLQTRDASANEHIRYIKTGVHEAFANIKIFLIGNGYGVSANILGGNSKYANFHNAYISFFVECGLLSLIFFISLLIYPLCKNKTQFPIVAVLIFANIPYQIYVEPYFWFLLPFICIIPQTKYSISTEGGSNVSKEGIRLI